MTSDPDFSTMRFKSGDDDMNVEDGVENTESEDGDVNTQDGDGDVNTQDGDGVVNVVDIDGGVNTQSEDGGVNMEDGDGVVDTEDGDEYVNVVDIDGGVNTQSEDGGVNIEDDVNTEDGDGESEGSDAGQAEIEFVPDERVENVITINPSEVLSGFKKIPNEILEKICCFAVQLAYLEYPGSALLVYQINAELSLKMEWKDVYQDKKSEEYRSLVNRIENEIFDAYRKENRDKMLKEVRVISLRNEDTSNKVPDKPACSTPTIKLQLSPDSTSPASSTDSGECQAPKLSTADVLVYSQPLLDEPINTKLVVSLKSDSKAASDDILKELLSRIPYQRGHIFGLEISPRRARLFSDF
ncbi:hypothetical protein AC249_AIPGENE16698 [Exaiptasia diaphana]|nr:hypothetical protein AC249_AIPGENE16698 [Exaiptasia diaphana]